MMTEWYIHTTHLVMIETGFGGHGDDRDTLNTIDRAHRKEAEADGQLCYLLNELLFLLPMTSQQPMLAEFQHLLRGRFHGDSSFCTLSKLFVVFLRNDSLQDWNSRGDLYKALLSVIQGLSRHYLTAPFLRKELLFSQEDGKKGEGTTSCQFSLSVSKGSVIALLENMKKPGDLFKKYADKVRKYESFAFVSF